MSVFQLVRRLDLLTMMGACAALTSLAGAETAPTYHATELGILGGRAEVGTFALDLNNQGHVVGYSSTPGTVHAFLWASDELMDIGASGDPDNTTIAHGVNRNDWVVGELTPPDSRARAFVWQNGIIRRLPPLEGANRALAHKINNANVIVGWTWNSEFEVNICERPTVWKPILTEPGRYRATEIDLPGTNQCGLAIDINDNGTVIGAYRVGDNLPSFIARNGQATRLPLSNVIAINASDQVLGTVLNKTTGVTRTVIWTDGTITSVGIRGTAFNNKGHVLGLHKTNFTPALWIAGTVYDLQSRVVSVDPQTSCAGQQLFLEFPRAINSRGQIIVNGWCSIPEGGTRQIAVLLTPIS